MVLDPKVRRVLAKLHVPAYPVQVSYFASEKGFEAVSKLLSLYAISTSEDYIWRLYYRYLVLVPGFPVKWLRRYKGLVRRYGILYGE
jgi:hypothetical protein